MLVPHQKVKSVGGVILDGRPTTTIRMSSALLLTWTRGLRLGSMNCWESQRIEDSFAGWQRDVSDQW